VLPMNAAIRPKPVKEDVLATRADRLSRALDAVIPGRERSWAECLDGHLAGIEGALRQHLVTAHDPEGVFAEVDETRPSLARQASQLRQDYSGLLGQCVALREEVQRVARAFLYEVPTTVSAAPDSLPTPSEVRTGTIKGEAPGRADETVTDLGAIRRQAEQLRDALQQTLQAETHLILDSVNTDIGVCD